MQMLIEAQTIKESPQPLNPTRLFTADFRGISHNREILKLQQSSNIHAQKNF